VVGDDPAGADVVLSGDAYERCGRIRCIFEDHRLISGALVASETTAQATLAFGDYVAAVGQAPARVGANVGTNAAGFLATQAIVASLATPGIERTIRVSPLRALSTLKTILWAARSRPDAWTGTHVRSRDRDVDYGYATRDRPITLDFPYNAPHAWLRFMDEIGVPPKTVSRLEPRWHETVGWGDDVDAARPIYEAAFSSLTSDDAVAVIRSCGGSSVPFLTLAECLEHPQARALGLRDSLAHGLPWRTRAVGSAPTRWRGSRPSLPPLHGLRVVDFGVGGVGPFGGALLAWLGADVIKIEAPNEFILNVRPTAGGISTTYLALNQGKRSVKLDLKAAADRELADAVVASADVVLENFRPGALDRIGFGFDDLVQRNPSLIYASATGFGWDGPWVNEPCTDPHMQAFSGFASLNADAEGRPRRIRYYGFVDLVTSTVVAEAICSGLAGTMRGGGACRCETSMLHAVAEVQQSALPEQHHVLDGFFRTLDGYVAVTCRTDADRARLDATLVEAAPAARDLESALAQLPGRAWENLLGTADVPCSRVLHDDEAIARRDLWEAGILQPLPLGHGAPLIGGGPPWILDDYQPEPPKSPIPGESTDELRAKSVSFWHAS
jgi:crotonobetainyl-CoA:carnitine CoA-transferase CaiB-like acyl-CoA transferase